MCAGWVRGEGRGVSNSYGVKDAACPLSTRGGGRRQRAGQSRAGRDLQRVDKERLTRIEVPGLRTKASAGPRTVSQIRVALLSDRVSAQGRRVQL